MFVIYIFFNFIIRYYYLQFSLKSLSITRWSMHHDSVKALINGYSDILKTLNYIHEEKIQKKK